MAQKMGFSSPSPVFQGFTECIASMVVSLQIARSELLNSTGECVEITISFGIKTANNNMRGTDF